MTKGHFGLGKYIGGNQTNGFEGMLSLSDISLNGLVIKNGLICYLDAYIPSSYPGSGTTWNDISGNNNNGELTNGVSFNSAGRFFTLDGVDDYIGFQDDPDLQTNNITWSVWFKTTTTTTGSIIRKRLYGYSLGITTGGGFNGFVNWNTWNNAASPGNTACNSTAGYNDGIWHNATGTYNGTTVSLYMDGYLVANNPNGNGNIFYVADGIAIGRDGGNNGNFLAGDIGAALVYNRALSASEVLQNFNAMRGRFNV